MKKGISGFMQEFKAFAVKGNVMDLAVGVIIGGAFGKITTSLVNDVLMPLIGMLLGGVDFASLSLTLPSFWSRDGDPAILRYGSFIGSVVDFVIIAFCVFIMVKVMNRFKQKPEPSKPAEPSKQELLLAEIRDLLKVKDR